MERFGILRMVFYGSHSFDTAYLSKAGTTEILPTKPTPQAVEAYLSRLIAGNLLYYAHPFRFFQTSSSSHYNREYGFNP